MPNIPADQFDFKPTPRVRSVRELAQHILEVAMMMTGYLTRPGALRGCWGSGRP